MLFKKCLPIKLFSKAGRMTRYLKYHQKMTCIYLLAFLLTSLGESLWDDLERELSLWDLSDRSDLGDGDFTRLPLLLRVGLGDALCRLFLWNKAPKVSQGTRIHFPLFKLPIIFCLSSVTFTLTNHNKVFSNNIQSLLSQ